MVNGRPSCDPFEKDVVGDLELADELDEDACLLILVRRLTLQPLLNDVFDRLLDWFHLPLTRLR